MLAVPFAGFLDEVVKISEGKLTQTAGFDRINIVNDDLGADGIAVTVALRQDITDLFQRTLSLLISPAS